MSEPSPGLRVVVNPTGQKVDARGSVCYVIDVLRACTTIAYALHAKSRGIIPVDTVEEATRLVATLDRDTTLLCGERHSVPIDGFDLGNSPSSMAEEIVADKTLVLTTTNGARILASLAGAKECLAASLVTRRACAQRAIGAENVMIVCAGAEGGFSREDFFCAGLLAEEIERLCPGIRFDDAARTAQELARTHRDDPHTLIRTCEHGRELASLGFEADLALASTLDRFPFAPILRDGRLVAEAEELPSAR